MIAPEMRQDPSASRSKWTPILGGALADRALESIHDVATALIRAEAERKTHPVEEEGFDLSLAGGRGGEAVFFAYLHAAEPAHGFDEIAYDLLVQSVEGLEKFGLRPSFFSGFTGIAWTVAHLQPRLLLAESDELFETIDAALLGHLERFPEHADYDLVSGLVGFGTYALERLPHPAGLACLEKVLERLTERAVHTEEGVTWWTPPERLHPTQREVCPGGFYNLGLAHGVPGVIALLGRAAEAQVARVPSRRLLEQATAWVLSKKLPEGSATAFPAWQSLDEAVSRPSRMAWCYGDPGVAVALVQAARCLETAGEESPRWLGDAIEIALRAASSPPEKSGVVDTPLCHGSAGLAHVFNRLFQATGEGPLREAARYWFEHTLDHRVADTGVAGFGSFEEGKWKARPGLLGGAAGVGLALLGGITETAPDWDRMLLASPAPRRKL